MYFIFFFFRISDGEQLRRNVNPDTLPIIIRHTIHENKNKSVNFYYTHRRATKRKKTTRVKNIAQIYDRQTNKTERTRQEANEKWKCGSVRLFLVQCRLKFEYKFLFIQIFTDCWSHMPDTTIDFVKLMPCRLTECKHSFGFIFSSLAVDWDGDELQKTGTLSTHTVHFDANGWI